MLEITVLGCGSSLGVPVIGCDCAVCKSRSSYNKRSRSAIYISGNNTKIIIDFGFDIKDQLIKANIKELDGAILTHDHADHVAGIDNLRVFSFLQNCPLAIYTDIDTANIIEDRYNYLFVKKALIMRPVDFFAKFKVNNLEIQFFRQNHGEIDSLGVRVGDFVYSNDVVNFPVESEPYLYNIKIWILDCIDYISNDVHSGMDKVLQWNEKFKPEKIYLINMHHNIDYHTISKELPHNIEPLYDGYKLVIR